MTILLYAIVQKVKNFILLFSENALDVNSDSKYIYNVAKDFFQINAILF